MPGPFAARSIGEARAWTRAERWLVAGVAGLLVLAILLPAIRQDPAYHRFADTRSLFGIANAGDVLSNALFFVFGVGGLRLLARGRRIGAGNDAMRIAATVFLVGLVASAIGSSYYHLAPDDDRLVWDRLGMVVAFAGVAGLAAADRVSARAAHLLWPIGLACGIASVVWYARTGSVTPYAVVQFGGIALIACLMWLPRRGDAGPNWPALIGAYALAKMLEMGDAQVFAMSGGTVSGHTLKHVVAACAALAVIVPLVRDVRQH